MVQHFAENFACPTCEVCAEMVATGLGNCFASENLKLQFEPAHLLQYRRSDSGLMFGGWGFGFRDGLATSFVLPAK